MSLQVLSNSTNICTSIRTSPLKALRISNSNITSHNKQLIQCSNCECNDNVYIWCKDCTSKQYQQHVDNTHSTDLNDSSSNSSPLMLLCNECNIGLHKNSKMNHHQRSPLHLLIKSIQGTDTFTLICSNCENDHTTVFCSECEQIQCNECNIAIHQPKTKKLHTRYPFYYKQTIINYAIPRPRSGHTLSISSLYNKRATAPIITSTNINQLNTGICTPPITEQSNNIKSHIPSTKIDNTTPTSNTTPSGKSRVIFQRAVHSAKPTVPGNKLLQAMNNARTSPLSIDIHSKLNGDVLQCIDAACTGDLTIDTVQFKNTVNEWDVIGTVQITQISCGRQHSGAVTLAGSLFMWGSNLESQLGVREDIELDGDRESHTPLLVQLPGNERVSQLACGYDHNICLTQSGSVYTWGHGLMFKLGFANDMNIDTPTRLNVSQYGTPVDLNEQIIYVAAGEHNSGCIVRGRNDGAQLYIWGANNTAQCGTGDKEPKSTPTLITIRDAHGQCPLLCSLAFGAQHTIAVTVDGDVYAWGNNTFGQLGYPNQSINPSVDSLHQPSTPSSAKQNNHIRGKSLSSARFDSMSGVDTELQLTPKLVKSLHDQGIKIIQAGCGEIHTNVLSSLGEIWSWGSGETHQIGIWDNIDQFNPIRCHKLGGDNPLLRAVYISVGVSMSGAVTDTGDIYIWGYSAETPVPQLVQGMQSNCIQRIECGDAANFICLTGIGNEVYEWKFNDTNESCQLLNEPQLVRALRGKRINDISIGKTHHAVVTQTGKLLTWGTTNEYLGIECDESFDCSIPHDVFNSTQYVIKQVHCAPEHCIVLTQSGRVLTWGSGDMGRLGHGNCIDLVVPHMVDTLNKYTIIDIAIGPQNTGVITSDGLCFVWGSNAGGQLGTNTIEPSFVPVQIQLNKPIKCIAFGNRHSAFCTVDGELYTIGDNTFAQLGIGSCNESKSLQPIQVQLLSNVRITNVECGDNVTLCLTDNGVIYGFGACETQQLGTATDDISIPKQIHIPFEQDTFNNKPTKIIDISVSSINCAALSDNGSVYCWGWSFGQPTIVNSLAQSAAQIRTISMGQNSLIMST